MPDYLFENSFYNISYMADYVEKQTVTKHHTLGTIFVYKDWWAGDYAVGWSPDRRENWLMRLAYGFETVELAHQWLKEHHAEYEPDPIYLKTRKETKARRRPRDSQRKKVYRWERVLKNQSEWLDHQFSTKEEFLAFVHEIYDLIDCPMSERPEITFRRGKTAYYWEMMHRLNFPPKWSWNRWVALHEIAHHVTDWTVDSSTVPAHGTHFVKIYLELLLMCTPDMSDADDNLQDIAFRLCRHHKVKYSEPDYTTFDDKSQFQSTIRGRLSSSGLLR